MSYVQTVQTVIPTLTIHVLEYSQHRKYCWECREDISLLLYVLTVKYLWQELILKPQHNAAIYHVLVLTD